MANYSSYFKNIFWILLLAQVAPSLIKAIRKQYTEMLEPKVKIGVIKIENTLSNSDKYIKTFKKFFEDKSIKAILLDVDCPGGSAGTSQVIFNELKLRKQESNKPVIALVENIAASGGYYVACASDYIVSSPAAFIGSIGVYISYPYFKDFIENYKVKYEIIKAGKYKTVGNPFAEPNAQNKEMLEELTKNVYTQFINDVRLNRTGVSDDASVWAEGKIFTGQQALQLKLIDELGSITNATRVLKERAHIDADAEVEFIYPSKDRSWVMNMLYPNESDGENSLANIISNVIKTTLSNTEQFKLTSSC